MLTVKNLPPDIWHEAARISVLTFMEDANKVWHYAAIMDWISKNYWKINCAKLKHHLDKTNKYRIFIHRQTELKYTCKFYRVQVLSRQTQSPSQLPLLQPTITINTTNQITWDITSVIIYISSTASV